MVLGNVPLVPASTVRLRTCITHEFKVDVENKVAVEKILDEEHLDNCDEETVREDGAKGTTEYDQEDGQRQGQRRLG